MEYHSKSYRLDTEVVDAIERAKAGGTSPNRFLRQLMGLDDGSNGGPEMVAPSVKATPVDPETIPGVVKGVANLLARPETSRERMLREKAEKEARIRARSSIGDDPSFVADPEYAQD